MVCQLSRSVIAVVQNALLFKIWSSALSALRELSDMSCVQATVYLPPLMIELKISEVRLLAYLV